MFMETTTTINISRLRREDELPLYHAERTALLNLRSRCKHRAWGDGRLCERAPGTEHHKTMRVARETGDSNIGSQPLPPTARADYFDASKPGAHSQSLASPQAICFRLLRRLNLFGTNEHCSLSSRIFRDLTQKFRAIHHHPQTMPAGQVP